MLIEIAPKLSISSVMGYLKGKRSLAIYERWGNVKFRYRHKEFGYKENDVSINGKCRGQGSYIKMIDHKILNK